MSRPAALTAVGLVVTLLHSSFPAWSKGPDAAEILRRAEEVRSPARDYAADFTIGVLDAYSPGVERKMSYTLIAHGKDRTIIVMRTPAPFYGGMLLIEHSAYWMLLPRAAKAFQLSPAQILVGDVSNGDLARANLAAAYEARLDGEETVDGGSCWRLILTHKLASAGYPRIRCWVLKKGFQPRRFEYYGLSGEKLRIVKYADYRSGHLGLRPMRIEVENTTGAGGTSTMIFSDLRKIDAAPIAFTPDGLAPFRDAALATRSGDETLLRLDAILAMLAAGKS